MFLYFSRFYLLLTAIKGTIDVFGDSGFNKPEAPSEFASHLGHLYGFALNIDLLFQYWTYLGRRSRQGEPKGLFILGLGSSFTH